MLLHGSCKNEGIEKKPHNLLKVIIVTYLLVGENIKNEDAGGIGNPLFASLNSDI